MMLMMLALGGAAPNKTDNTRCGQCLWVNATFNAFLGFWSQSSQNGLPIVLMMLLYEARARARGLRTGTSSAQLGPHFGSVLS